jgi:hypothetical protein
LGSTGGSSAGGSSCGASGPGLLQHGSSPGGVQAAAVVRTERAATAHNTQPADWHDVQQQHAGSSTTGSSQGDALNSSSLQSLSACISSGLLSPAKQQQGQELGQTSSSGFWAAPGTQAAGQHGSGPYAAASTQDSSASVWGLSSGERGSGCGLLLEVQAAPASDLSAVVVVMPLTLTTSAPRGARADAGSSRR